MMGKGSKQKVEETQTLDPEVKRRLYGTMDTVNRWTSGVLDDGSPGTPSYQGPQTPQGGMPTGYGTPYGDFQGGNYTGYGQQPMGYRTSDAPGGDTSAGTAWKPPTTFTADHTDATQNFINQAQNPDVSGADFRSIADRYGDTPTYGWEDGQAAQVEMADYGDTPVIQAEQAKSFMGDYLDGSMGYTKNVIDSTRDILNRERGKRALQSQMNMTASGGGGGMSWRQGLADAEVESDYMNSLADVTARLGDQGWTRALGAATGDAGRKLQADSRTADYAAQRLQNIFASDMARRENNAARSQMQSLTDQAGRYKSGLDTEAARLAGLAGESSALTQGNNIDQRNMAMLGTAAGIEQDLADRRAREPLDMLQLRMASAGMLPNLTNTSQTSSVKPGLFDWVGLGVSAVGNAVG